MALWPLPDKQEWPDPVRGGDDVTPKLLEMQPGPTRKPKQTEQKGS